MDKWHGVLLVISAVLLLSNIHWIENAFAALDQTDRAIATAQECQNIAFEGLSLRLQLREASPQ